jgi:hypothetical protein
MTEQGNENTDIQGAKKDKKSITLERVRIAVEEELEIKDFINGNAEKICSRIEEYDRNVTKKKGKMVVKKEMQVTADVTFIADCLPLISGVVSIGCSKESYENACAWIEDKFPNHEPIPLLSALTFIYIVNESDYVKKQLSSDDPDKKEIWTRIQGRVWRNLTE